MMSRQTSIAISGVGGGVGQSIMKALHGTRYTVVGMDSEPLGTGLYAAAKGYVIPYAHESGYVERVLDICAKEKCALLFPGLDAELPMLAEYVGAFKKIGTTVVVSSPRVVEICDNKMLTYRFLSDHAIPVPTTVDFPAFCKDPTVLTFPVILKPKIGGARSKNVFLLRKQSDLHTIRATHRMSRINGIVQEYIDGDEYTCGTVNLDGKHLGTIVMRRILRDGDTYKCFSVRHEGIERTVAAVMNHLRPFGACNVQLRLKNGVPYVLEINARCSGTTAARAIAGFNEPKMIIEYIVQGIRPTCSIKEMTILRYWNELPVQNDKVRLVAENGSITNRTFESL